MPISHIKLFNFNIGSAYLLATNYQDAKSRLSKCLESDPQGKLKSYALNNLGLACWWHKNPIEKTRD
jgi:Tfp pilus assembly protein PilF